jgi:hypothetical protein
MILYMLLLEKIHLPRKPFDGIEIMQIEAQMINITVICVTLG